MNMLSQLDRSVVWRFEAPTRAELASFQARVSADLSSTRPVPAVRPFLVATPVAQPALDTLQRDLGVRGVRVVETRGLHDWPRAATVLGLRSFEPDELVRAYTREELWRALFPRGEGQLWMLQDELDLERARAWEAGLRQLVRGVRVTIQGVLSSFESDLNALHVPATADCEREWRALAARR